EMIVFYDLGLNGIGRLFGVLALGTAALSATGTLHASLAAHVRSQQVMLLLLLFPLMLPVLIAALRASSLLLLGDPMEQAAYWALLLVACNGIFWPLCGLLFGYVIEE